MTAFSLRLTNGANAVSLLHGHTANGTWYGVSAARDPGPHERRPHADLGRPADARHRSSATRTPTSTPWTTSPRSAASGSALAQIPTDELWEAHQRQKLELAIFARGRLRSQFARHGEAPATLEELEEVLDPGILTIGFARRFATYKRAALLFTDLDRLAGIVWDAERPVQIIFAGKAHPADRPGPGRHPGHLRPLAEPQAPRPRVHPRGLRHPDRPLPRPGRGRLAQQPAPPARGVRHVRHEGRRERRAQRERARRLVGRGLDGRQRLGHRRPRDQPGRGRPGLGRRAGPVPDPRGGADPGLLRARRGRPARPLGPAHAQLDREHDLALLDDPDAPRVRRAAVPAGGGRRRPEATAAATSPRTLAPVAASRRRVTHTQEDRTLAPRISLALAIHNHQPVGNFGWVFAEVYEPRLPADARGARAPPGRPPLAPLHGPAPRVAGGRAARVPRAPRRARRRGPGRAPRRRPLRADPRVAPRARPRRPADAHGRRRSRASRAAGRRARGSRSASGSPTCRRRSPRRATAGRSSTTSTSAPRRSPRRTSGAPTRPRTRATC